MPTPSRSTSNATPAMTDDTILPFSFPAVHAKKVTAAFDGGRLTSNGGVMLLAMAERRLGLADNLARVFPDRRDPTRVVHSLVDMFRARMFAICCGYEDADDLDHLRSDPAFKLACGRLPDTGRDLCSQPTLSRLEKSPPLRDGIRLTYTLVPACMGSHGRAPTSLHQPKEWAAARTTPARGAQRRTCLFCGANPSPATRQSPGIANGVPSPVLRR